MDNPNYSIEHRKGQHLLAEERHGIEVRLGDGWSPYRIAKALGRPYNTVKNEIRRGTVQLCNGKVPRYKADAGEAAYKGNRSNSRRQHKRLNVSAFCEYVERHFCEDKWSLDACHGRALASGAFQRDKMVCTKPLYHYVDKGLLNIQNMDLPEKPSRNTRRNKVRKNRRILGDGIELRTETVEAREEFGHWEIDTVVESKKGNGPCALTIVEGKTRNAIWAKAENHTSEAIRAALEEVLSSFGSRTRQVFRSITGDNGSEFAGLSECAKRGISVYFAHPHSPCEKGTNECHDRLLRRFIPKGKSMAGYTSEDIAYMAGWANGLPRKILGYHTPEELFEAELDKIYAL